MISANAVCVHAYRKFWNLGTELLLRMLVWPTKHPVISFVPVNVLSARTIAPFYRSQITPAVLINFFVWLKRELNIFRYWSEEQYIDTFQVSVLWNISCYYAVQKIKIISCWHLICSNFCWNLKRKISSISKDQVLLQGSYSRD